MSIRPTAYQQVFLNYSPSRSSEDFITIAQEIPRSQTPSKVHALILEHLSVENVSSTSVLRSKKTLFFKTVFCLYTLAGRVTLIPVTKAFFAKNMVLGDVASACNVIAFGSYFMWSSLNMIDQIALNIATDETSQTRSCERIRKICMLAFNVINGVAAQLPLFYLLWNYNRSEHLLLILNALDVVLPIYSLQLMSKKKIIHAAYCQSGKKVLEFKKKLLEKLDHKLKTLEQKGSSSITRLFQDLDQISDPFDKAGRFFDLLFAEQPEDLSPENPFIETFRENTAKLIAQLLLSVQLFWFGYLTYLGMSEWNAKPLLNGFTCLYVVIANIALTRLVMLKSTRQLINATHRVLCTRRPFTYINERIFAKTSLIERIISLALAVTTCIPAATLSEDFLPEALKLPSTITFGIALGLLNYLPTRELFDKLSAKTLFCLASNEEKIELKTHSQLSSIKKIIENASPESLAIFLLKNEEHPLMSYMLSRFDFTIDDLLIFINKSSDELSIA